MKSLKAVPIDEKSGYHRKAKVAIQTESGLVGFKKRCAKDTRTATDGATKNAKLNLMLLSKSGTPVQKKIEGNYGGAIVTLNPWSPNYGIVGSVLVKNILALLKN